MRNMKAAVQLSVPTLNSRAEAFDPALASLFASSVSSAFLIRCARAFCRANGMGFRLARYNLPLNDTYPNDHPARFLLLEILKMPLLNLKLQSMRIKKQMIISFEHKPILVLSNLARKTQMG